MILIHVLQLLIHVLQLVLLAFGIVFHKILISINQFISIIEVTCQKSIIYSSSSKWLRYGSLVTRLQI